jgi:hypothetical protein
MLQALLKNAIAYDASPAMLQVLLNPPTTPGPAMLQVLLNRPRRQAPAMLQVLYCAARICRATLSFSFHTRRRFPPQSFAICASL